MLSLWHAVRFVYDTELGVGIANHRKVTLPREALFFEQCIFRIYGLLPRVAFLVV